MKHLSAYISSFIAKDSNWKLTQKDEPLRDLSNLDFVVKSISFVNKVAEPLLRSVYFENVKVWNENTVAYYFNGGVHLVLSRHPYNEEPKHEPAPYALPNTPYGRLLADLIGKLEQDTDCLGGRAMVVRYENDTLYLRYNGADGSVVLQAPIALDAYKPSHNYDRAQPTSA